MYKTIQKSHVYAKNCAIINSILKDRKREIPMMKDTLLLTPGPTNVPEKYANILAEPFPHHRTGAFAALQKELYNNLLSIMKAPAGSELVMFTCSGSGAMESTICNFYSAGDKILVVDTGHFGHRYTEMGEQFGLEVISLVYTPGTTYDFNELIATIDAHPDLKGVYMTHHETSSGILNDIAQVGTYLQSKEDILFIVDAVSGLLMHPLEMEAWGVNVIAGASQKGFLLPPGCAFVGLDSAALARLEHATLPKFYWNYELMMQYAEKGETPCTPAINLMRAFLASTRDILASGVDASITHHKELKKYVLGKINAHGLKIAVDNLDNLGNVCIPVVLPEGTDAMEICRYLEAEHKIILIGGFGAYAHSMVRVGLIGPLETTDFDRFFIALKDTMSTLYNIAI